MTSKPSSRTRPPLNRQRVLQTAIRIADEDGIEALTMRKLARALGVEAMSLYNHVANKGDLVQGIVDLVVEKIELPDEERAWDAAIRRCAVSAHDVLVRHPWACSLIMAPGSAPGRTSPRLRYIEWILRRLREAGFSADLTYHAYHAIDSHVLGFTMWQLGHAAGAKAILEGEDFGQFAASFVRELRTGDFPHLAEHVEQHLAASNEGESEFEFGLDLILDGLRRARKRG